MKEILFNYFYGHGILSQPIADWQMYALLMIAILVGITVHEFGHAWMADKLGDPGPRAAGRVTLNPLAHLDPLGTLVVIASTLIGFPVGWGKPVKTDPDAYKVDRRLGTALVAFAGPVMNLLLAIAIAPFARFVIGQIGGPEDPLILVLLGMAIVMVLNLSLFCFNLVPIHPLDGSHILANLLPPALGEVYGKFMKHYGSYILIALLITGKLGAFLGPLVIGLFRLLLGV